MEDISDIRSLSLSSLNINTRRLLSNLLDSTKVLTTEGPLKRHRDWRGLASLVNISSELESTIWHYNDKTGKVLELWMQSRAGTVGELLEHLIALDRFDVYDDIIDSIREHNQRPENQVALVNNNHNQYNNHLALVNDHELITFEDRPGHRHIYHAYVLYAEENKEFVFEMKHRLVSHGFEVCMKDNLLPGYASQFPPVSKLISERCKRIVLVYSPEFLQCHDNSFFRDYAQALSIRLDQRIMLPIMYKKCELPSHLSIYWQLYYNTNDLDNFWDRLIKSMEVTRYAVNAEAAAPQQYNSTLSNSLNIHTMSNSAPNSYSQLFLPAKTVPIVSPAPSDVSLTPSAISLAPSTISLPQSLASQMNTTEMLVKPMKKKKRSIMKSISGIFSKGKKNKNKIVDTITPLRAEQCA